MTLKKSVLWTVAVLGFSTLPLLGACTTQSGESVEASKFGTALSAAYCEGEKNCCERAHFTYDDTACKTSFGLGFTEGEQPNTIYDGVAAKECVDGIRAAAESCGARPFDLGKSSPCSRIYIGKLHAGDTCTQDVECEHGPNETAFCQGAVSATTGATRRRCAVARAPRVGDSCERDAALDGSPTVIGDCDSSSGSDLTCQGNTRTCQPRAALGAECSVPSDCVAEGTCKAGVCVAWVALGGECDSSSVCARGLYCDGHSCTAPKEPGEPCIDDKQCGTNVCDGTGVCSDGFHASRNTCSG